MEVSVTTLEIDASILDFLDVSSDIDCYNSYLRSLAFPLGFSPQASQIPLFIWIGSRIELAMLIMGPSCRESYFSRRILPSDFGFLSEGIYAKCWYLY